MSLSNRLASIMGVAAMSAAPAVAQATTTESTPPSPPAQVQQADVSWYQTAWNYTGGAIGAGIDYAGKGLTKIGEGITWTAEHSVLYPVRGVAKGSAYVSDKIEKGFEWVEEKTGIPTQTASGLVSMPSRFIFSVTDNTADFVAESPKAVLGVTGSTLGVVGNTIKADTKGIKDSAKNLAGNSWDLAKTGVGDAGMLALSVAGTAAMAIPIGDIARDGIALANRTADLASGNADLSKPVPRDALSAAKYSYDKIVHGKEAADQVRGSLFISAGNVKVANESTSTPVAEKPQPPQSVDITADAKKSISQLNPAIIQKMVAGKSNG